MLAVCPVRMEHLLRLDMVQMPSSVSSEPLSMVVPGQQDMPSDLDASLPQSLAKPSR